MDPHRPEWLPEDRIDSIRTLLRHAVNVSRLYAQLRTPDGRMIDRIDPATELPLVPILTRRSLASNTSTITAAPEGRPAVLVSTSGTSHGLPVRIPVDASGRRYGRSLLGRHPAIASISPGSKALAVNWHHNRTSRHLTEQRMLSVVPCLTWIAAEPDWRIPRVVTRHRPRVVYGNPRSLTVLATAWPAAVPGPSLVLSSDEVLDAPVRDYVASRLQATVLDIYSMRELSSCIAWQTSHAGIYRSPRESVLVEVVDQRGQPVSAGSWGRVVVTDLLNRACPLIRYDTDDLARAGEPFGLLGSTLECIGGRSYETLRDRSGIDIPIGGTLIEVAEALGGPVTVSPSRDGRSLEVDFVPLIAGKGGPRQAADLLQARLATELEITVRDLPRAAYADRRSAKWARIRRPSP